MTVRNVSERPPHGVDPGGRVATSLPTLTAVARMAKRSSRRGRPLVLIVAEMMAASWETMARRNLMMVQGACSPAEYRRMAAEKFAAMQQSALAVMSGRGKKAALAPWHKRATANAKRLRAKS